VFAAFIPDNEVTWCRVDKRKEEKKVVKTRNPRLRPGMPPIGTDEGGPESAPTITQQLSKHVPSTAISFSPSNATSSKAPHVDPAFDMEVDARKDVASEHHEITRKSIAVTDDLLF
jgi:hypothetical protein